MVKKLLVLTVCMIMATAMLIGCQTTTDQTESTESPSQSSSATQEPEVTVQETATPAASEAVEPELDIQEVFGAGPNGEIGTAFTDLEFTDEELQKLKDGDYKVAICMHMMSNAVNYTKAEVMKQTFESYGVNVVSVSDANLSAATMTSNVESAMALEPDLIIACCADQIANKPVFEEAKEAGIKLVFYELPPDGWVSGQDYDALVSSDFYGNGRFAAEYMAYLLNYKGTVGMVFADMNYWTCNERDKAFREVMAKYPDIEIVADEGFAQANMAGTVADGILAKYPDIDGIYATWDDPAEQVCASAVAVGRDDLIVTTVDLGENTARVIAQGGMIKAVGSGRAYEDGIAITNAACYALLGKEMPSAFIETPTMGVTKANVLEAYKTIFNTDPSSELVDAWNEANK